LTHPNSIPHKENSIAKYQHHSTTQHTKNLVK
jgi:hypothetical protein